MTDLDKMMRAEQYIRKMAEGINPITDETVSEQDMINNVRITRCLYYVSDVLREVIANNGVVSRKRNNVDKKADFFLTDEQRASIVLFDEPVYARSIAEKLNEFVEVNNCKKFSIRWITEYFLSIGMLEMFEGNKRATEAGREFGIISEKRYGYEADGYWANLFTPDAQRFIVDNLDAIIAFSKTEQYTEQIRRNKKKYNTEETAEQ